MSIISVSLEFALLVFVGFLIMRIKLVNADFRGQLSRFVINVLLPCMIARSLYGRSDSGEGDILLIFALSLSTIVLLFIIGQLAYLLLGRGDIAKTARFSTLFGNFTFIGFPVVTELYGQEGLFIYALFTLPIRVVFYAAPHFLLSPDKGKRRLNGRELARLLITPPTVSIVVGLALLLAHLQPPSFIDAAVNALGSAASPLGMLIVGMGMADATPKLIWQRRRVCSAVLLRNIIAPAVILLMLLLVPADAQIKQVIFTYAAVPVPSLMTAFSVNAGRSDEACRDASVTVLASTLLSIVTLPCWIYLLRLLLS